MPSIESGTFGAISAILEKQNDKMLQLLREERTEFETKLQKLQPTADISEEQVVALLERIERMQAADLLKADELFSIEDTISDFVEVRARVGVVSKEIIQANPIAGALKQLVSLSETLVSDPGFARQLRRKFL